ncbi:MAG: ABC transporter substrate-binding protein [Deltaproteobacteria bacterium]|nr:ABC transporter substrate-binding protein [Deltaproteobacteria bacterium]
MDLIFAHYRNRFCMFRTYYALAKGLVKPDGFTLQVVELPDPPSHEQEEALIRGDVQVANLYLPNFLRCKLQGAPIVGISTEWKSTMKGNGIFVLEDGPIKTPQDLSGRLIASHQGAHAIHRYLLKHRYGVDEKTLRWESHPQEELLHVLKSGKVDAVVLLDQFFFRGEKDAAVRCLYTDGEAWKALRGFSEMIKHMVAVREPLLKEHPELREKLLQTFRASFQYSEGHLEEISAEFIKRYGGDREALIASARYPRIEFTFTNAERKLADAELKMLVEVGELPHRVPICSVFAA